MARTNTLTAYRCTFSYMQRNNPLIEEQRGKIKAGDTPQFSLADFIALYGAHSKNVLVGQNSDRAISLSAEGVVARKINNLNAWRISPIAGKQGQPMTVVKKTSKQRYNFGADAVALYNYNIFFYEDAGNIIAIFHRQNGSGCKSVFLETANELLKAKGLKLEMELIPIVVSALVIFGIPYRVSSELGEVLTTVFSLVFSILFGFAAVIMERNAGNNSKKRQVVNETFVSIVTATILSLAATIASIFITQIEDACAISILSVALFALSLMIVMLILMITKRAFVIYCDSE